nr:hypothetical protein [uncultured Flavobacterium sp.]
MKKLHGIVLLLFVALINVSEIHAQVVTEVLYDKMRDDIIKRKSIFVVDYFDVEDVEDIMKEVWTFNPFVVISKEEYNENAKKYINDSTVLFMYKALARPTQAGTYHQQNYIGYSYVTNFKYNTDGTLKKYDTKPIATINFGPNHSIETWEKILAKKIVPFESLYNYKLGFLKNYLQYLNGFLNKKYNGLQYDITSNKEKLQELKNVTLLVPEFINDMMSKRTEKASVEELFINYPYKYQQVSDAELNRKILETKEDFYYYIQTNVFLRKHISIINGRTGEVIYHDFSNLDSRVRAKDIDPLLKILKK